MMRKFWITIFLFSSTVSADPLGYSMVKKFVDIDELLLKQNIQVQGCSFYYKGKLKRESSLGACVYHYVNFHISNKGKESRVVVDVRFPFQPPSSSDFSLELDWNPIEGEGRSFLLRVARYVGYVANPGLSVNLSMVGRMYKSLRHVEFILKSNRPIPLEYIFSEEKIIYFTAGLLMEDSIDSIKPSVSRILISKEPYKTQLLKRKFKDKINVDMDVGVESDIQSEMVIDYSLNLKGIKLNEIQGEAQLMGTDLSHMEEF